MKLDKLCQHGDLRYFHQQPAMMSVYENNHYRWLNFCNITQSIMNLRNPATLTLPHQNIMLLPLALLPFTSVTEIGLGGGNHARFLLQHQPELNYFNIENNHHVIDCFHQFFNPQKLHFSQITGCFTSVEAKAALTTQWLIYDIFTEVDHDNLSLLLTFLQLCHQQPHLNCISINVPQSTHFEQSKIEAWLTEFHPHFYGVKFAVPYYQNTVYHLIRKNTLSANASKVLPLNKNGLPANKLKRWRQLWQHHQVLAA